MNGLSPNVPASGGSNKGGPLQEQATYARRVGTAAQLTVPVLKGQRDINRVLSRKQKLSAAEQALLARQDKLLAKALAAEQAVAKAVPRNQERQPVTLGVTEPFVTTFTVAGYAALLLSLPFLLYQAYAFILP
ncbi:MAG TPA: twin-arginine translocase subunit TatC, partial [Usitatibacter sp.]|nr:twin-arginine translocase subunit TatC [Usitatibacter sp.]